MDVTPRLPDVKFSLENGKAGQPVIYTVKDDQGDAVSHWVANDGGGTTTLELPLSGIHRREGRCTSFSTNSD